VTALRQSRKWWLRRRTSKHRTGRERERERERERDWLVGDGPQVEEWEESE